ncbi:MAG: hypothetical protein V1492_01220 [Candidatus Micrarchaeota archaeon]
MVAVKVLARRPERVSHGVHPLKKKLLAFTFAAALLLEGVFTLKPALARDIPARPAQAEPVACGQLASKFRELGEDENALVIVRVTISSAVEKKDALCLMQIASNELFPDILQIEAGTEAIKLYAKNGDTLALECLARNKDVPMKVRVSAGVKAVRIYKNSIAEGRRNDKEFIVKICEDAAMPKAVKTYAKYVLKPAEKIKVPAPLGTTGRQ